MTRPPVWDVLTLLYDGLDRTRIDEVMADIDRETAEIDRDWPYWARSLVDLLEAADGTRGQGAGGGHDGRVSDPTLGAVMRRERWTRERASVLGHLDDALYALKAARQLMAGVARTAGAAQLQADIARARCTGGMGMPRADKWGDPTCQKNAVRAGMCWRHYRAHLEDTHAHDLTQLERFS